MASSRRKANPLPITHHPLPITQSHHSPLPTRHSPLPIPQVGDCIRINDLHFVCAGMEFEIDSLDLDWVRTTDNSLFHRDYFDVIECSLPNSISAQESALAFPQQESSPEDLTLSDCATLSPSESIATSEISCLLDSPTSLSSTMSRIEVTGNRGGDNCQVSSQLLPLVHHSLLKEKVGSRRSQRLHSSGRGCDRHPPTKVCSHRKRPRIAHLSI